MGQVTLPLRVQPSAKRDQVVGLADGVLMVKVSAPARQGRANEAVVELLAKALGVRRSQITIVKGATTRDKVLAVEGLRSEELLRCLGAEQPSHPRVKIVGGDEG